uniref:Uncharacterized protein n=2 Tax=Oryza meridionalis TaxID=40149 RepID=A0A0E0FAC7_9ORYZ
MRVGRAAVAAAASRFWRLRRRAVLSTLSRTRISPSCSEEYKREELLSAEEEEEDDGDDDANQLLTYLSMMVARVVLGTAPMTLSFFSPFLNMRTVGMLRMPGNMTNGRTCVLPSSTALLHWQAKREAGRSGDDEATDSRLDRLLLPARRSLSLLPPAARPEDGGWGACRVAQALKHVSNAIILFTL